MHQDDLLHKHNTNSSPGGTSSDGKMPTQHTISHLSDIHTDIVCLCTRIFNSASMSSILANQVISMYGLFHPDYVYERWHVFMAFLIINWACCFLVMFANRALPVVTNIGLVLILLGVFITIMVCAIMPSQKLGGKGHASSSFVWKEWQNQTGWESNGLVFCMGMLNGAYAVGTP